MNNRTESLLEKFSADTKSAVSLLYEKRLYTHLLIVIYSSIDTMGLLDAPLSTISATGNTFKKWAKKYLIEGKDFEFNEVDLWGARCSVLHTLTSESDLSRANKAREIQYFSGPKDSAMAKAFVSATREIGDGKNVPAHLDSLYLAFIETLNNFLLCDFLRKCKEDTNYEKRLDKVLQIFAL